MERVNIESLIRGLARAIGFSEIGFARVDEIPPRRLDEWLRRRFQGEMAYLERNREPRLDPREILSGAKSIISVSLDYYRDSPPPYGEWSEGVVSRYARGVDYHQVMKGMLEDLWSGIRELEPLAEGRIYVDTGPVLEKEWAARAGIGWIGKHTNLISGKKGSWFFLGEILTSLSLSPSRPVADRCGSCTRCIEACPTDAIVEPYVLDARRCISYLTIELREDIPVALRPSLGNLIFGCDICQDVCPWNRQPRRSVTEWFKPADKDSWDLAELSRMTPEEFSRRFRRSPVKRAKWRGLLRNVAIAMGNSRSEEFVDDLLRLARSEDGMIRRHARWALEQIGGERAERALEALQEEPL